jgi:hypothetical protein
MVTIHHLEVHIAVDASDDDKAFARQFKRHIEHWNRAQEEARAFRRFVEAERTGEDE